MTKQQLSIPYINHQDRVSNGAKYKELNENKHHILPSSRLEADSDNTVVKLFTNFHSSYH